MPGEEDLRTVLAGGTPPLPLPQSFVLANT